jgi:hypothetical protein
MIKLFNSRTKNIYRIGGFIILLWILTYTIPIFITFLNKPLNHESAFRLVCICAIFGTLIIFCILQFLLYPRKYNNNLYKYC